MTEQQGSKQESPLKKRREELELTPRDVAVAIDVSVQTISNIMSGRLPIIRSREQDQRYLFVRDIYYVPYATTR